MPCFADFPTSGIFQVIPLHKFGITQIGVPHRGNALLQPLLLEINRKIITVSLEAQHIDRHRLGDFPPLLVFGAHDFILRHEQIKQRLRLEWLPAGERWQVEEARIRQPELLMSSVQTPAPEVKKEPDKPEQSIAAPSKPAPRGLFNAHKAGGFKATTW